MNIRVWYEAEAIAANMAVHRHTMMGVSEDDIGSRMRDLYRDAVLVYAAREVTKGGSDALSGHHDV